MEKFDLDEIGVSQMVMNADGSYSRRINTALLKIMGRTYEEYMRRENAFLNSHHADDCRLMLTCQMDMVCAKSHLNVFTQFLNNL